MRKSQEQTASRMRAALMGTTILVAFSSAFIAAPAVAQDTTEIVTVTGIRASLQSAQAIKQNSDQVVDSITAVDIGALPDNTVAEALQRVPGVQITRTDIPNDPLRWAGYGHGVFIRGLSWVKSLTNGEEIFGAENGRTISFADISADLMAGVDVYKNPSAKMIEGGVGGTVNLKTRKPFDFDGRKIAVSGNLDYGMLAARAGQSINAMVSDRFNTGFGELGVLFSASYQNLISSNNIGTTDPWNTTWRAGSYPNHAFTTPNNLYPKGFTKNFGMFGYRQMNWKQPRVALDATLQWRPTDSLEITFIGLYTKASPQNDEHNVAWIVPVVNPSVTADGDAANSLSTLPTGDRASALASLATYEYDAGGYLNRGTIFNAQADSTHVNYSDTRWDVRHHTNKNAELTIKWDPTANLSVTIDGSYVDSRANMSSMTIYNVIKNRAFTQSSRYSGNTRFYPNAPQINVGFDLTDGSPSFTYDDVGRAALADKSSYLWASAMDHYEDNYAHAYIARADASYTFNGAGLLGWVRSVDAGVRGAWKSSATRNSGWNWGRIGFQTWSLSNCGRQSNYGGNWLDPVTVCAATAGDFSNRMPDASTLYEFPAFFGASMPAVWEPKISWMKDPYGVWADVSPMQQAYSSLLYGYSSTGTNPTSNLGTGMWLPAIVRDGTCSGVAYNCDSVYTRGTVNAQREDTNAGYFVVNFMHGTFLGTDVPVDGNVGVRVVNTKYDSGPGSLRLPNVTECATAAANSDRAAACTLVGAENNATARYPGITNNYTHVLPSFNFRAGLSDTLQFRLGYSQGLVRPSLDRMRNFTTLSYAWGTMTERDNFALTNPRTGQGSNPYLKPTYSQNYDAGIEWYFAPSGNVALALFHKSISNYVMSGFAPMTFTRNGVTQTFTVGSYVNGDKGTVEGFEFSYQQFYDQLPRGLGGLGLQLNYTKIYNSGGANPVANYTDADAATFANDPTLPMEGMSNDSYNVALLYEKYGISGRVAWNWRSRYLVNSYPANVFQPVFQRSYGQLDASVLYSFLDHYKVGVQSTNLLKQSTILEVGRTMATKHIYQWVEGERKFSLVMRASW